MMQFAPAARLVPQLFRKTNEDALAPVNAMLVMGKVEPLVLVMTTDWEMLIAPTVVEG